MNNYTVYIMTYILNIYINIIHIIVNCELMGPHTNLYSRAHYLFEEINNNTMQHIILFNIKFRFLLCVIILYV